MHATHLPEGADLDSLTRDPGKRNAQLRLIAILVAVTLIGAILLSLQYQEREQRMQQMLQQHLQEFHTRYTASIQAHEQIIRRIFQDEIDTPAVRHYVSQALLSSGAARDIYRQRLERHLRSTYENLQRNGIRQLHFHTPDARSLLRMHRPSRYGDSLVGVRPSVVRANQEQRLVTGFEEGRIFNGYRFVFPLQGTGARHLGTVEISLGATRLTAFMHQLFGSQVRFFIDASVVRTKVFEDEQDNYRPSSLSPHLLREQRPADLGERPRIENRIIERLDQSLDADDQRLLRSFREFGRIHCLDGEAWLLMFMPITNVMGSPVGYLTDSIRAPEIERLQREYRFKFAAILLILVLMGAMLLRWEWQRQTSLQQRAQLARLARDQVRELWRREEFMLQQSRTATMGEMVGAIAHQLRQPLNAIQLIAQDMLDQYDYNELDRRQLQESVDSCLDQTRYMSATIDDFRAFLQPGNDEDSFDLTDAVQRAISLLRPQLHSASIGILTEFPPELAECRIRGSRNDFMQVLLVLLSNAREAIIDSQQRQRITTGGRIRIGARLLAERRVQLEIMDNGGGIPHEALARIFDSYFTTKGEKGTGIGLHLARFILHSRFDGDIQASNSEEGACFRIEIPRVDLH